MFTLEVKEHKYDASKALLHLSWPVPVRSGWQNMDTLIEIPFPPTVEAINAIREQIAHQTGVSPISFTSITALREGKHSG